MGTRPSVRSSRNGPWSLSQNGIDRGLSFPTHVSTTMRWSPSVMTKDWMAARPSPWSSTKGPIQSIGARFSAVASCTMRDMPGPSYSWTRVMVRSPTCHVRTVLMTGR